MPLTTILNLNLCLGVFVRVPTPQGKQGKWWKVIPGRENTGNLKFLEKHRENNREFENFKIENWNQESLRRKIAVWRQWFYFWCLKCCHFIIKIDRENWNYAGKSQGKHREFCFPIWVGTMICLDSQEAKYSHWNHSLDNVECPNSHSKLMIKFMLYCL